MKKFILVLVALLVFFTGSAQVKVESDIPYFDVQFKRAFVKGTSLFVDVLFVNTCAYDTYLQLDPGTIIDDEGNRYPSWYTDNNQSKQYSLKIPSEISQRLRFIIKNLDEYATSFQVIDFKCYVSNKLDPDWHGGRFGQVRLRNVPIKRENE